MLVLTRKKKQSLMLGNDIEIQILDIHGEQVRVGIKAPLDLRILRKEIYADIKVQNQAALVQGMPKADWQPCKKEQKKI